MSWTYDTSTDIGKVRLLITDRDSVNPIFQDEEIQAFLDMEDGSIRFAAATALDSMAANEVLVLKVIKTLDLETDGSKVAESLRKQAASLREQENSSGAFAVIEMTNGAFSARERLYKQALRRQSQ